MLSERKFQTFKALIYANPTIVSPQLNGEKQARKKCFLIIRQTFLVFIKTEIVLDDLAISAGLRRKVNQEFVLS